MLAVNANVKLSREERSAMLAVWDGYQPHAIVTTALHFLDLHCPRKYLLPCLQWLVRNNLKGKALHEFILGECGGRYLDFQRRLLVRVLRDAKVQMRVGETFV
jgi:hypothetical protein